MSTIGDLEDLLYTALQNLKQGRLDMRNGYSGKGLYVKLEHAEEQLTAVWEAVQDNHLGVLLRKFKDPRLGPKKPTVMPTNPLREPFEPFGGV